MAENLTDDALDVIIDIVMEVQMGLPRRLRWAREYWINLTRDWWYEWCGRRAYEHADMEENNAALEA